MSPLWTFFLIPAFLSVLLWTSPGCPWTIRTKTALVPISFRFWFRERLDPVERTNRSSPHLGSERFFGSGSWWTLSSASRSSSPCDWFSSVLPIRPCSRRLAAWPLTEEEEEEAGLDEGWHVQLFKSLRSLKASQLSSSICLVQQRVKECECDVHYRFIRTLSHFLCVSK